MFYNRRRSAPGVAELESLYSSGITPKNVLDLISVQTLCKLCANIDTQTKHFLSRAAFIAETDMSLEPSAALSKNRNLLGWVFCHDLI